MNDIKGIIEDVEKSDLVSKKVIKRVIEIIGQEKWQDIYDEEGDICTTTGELIITIKGIADLEKENAELEIKIKHLTKHLEPQSMTALFEQVEEEIKQEQRIKELQQENENLKRGYHYEVEVINGRPTDKAILVPDSLAYAKSIIQDLLNNSDEYAKQRAREFLENK